MGSHFLIPFTKANWLKTTGYSYHLVHVITFGMSQSDHIKWLLLYFDESFLGSFSQWLNGIYYILRFRTPRTFSSFWSPSSEEIWGKTGLPFGHFWINFFSRNTLATFKAFECRMNFQLFTPTFDKIRTKISTIDVM